MKPYQIASIVIFCLSFVTFIIYGIDKRKASKNKYRIKEATLLLFGLLGGAIGGLIGMQVFRHKTKKIYFYLINILGLFLHVLVVYYLI